MECKDAREIAPTVPPVVLIETLWNVKHDESVQMARQEAVLIETLWNVKISIVSPLMSRPLVLIETLWNVKM